MKNGKLSGSDNGYDEDFAERNSISVELDRNERRTDEVAVSKRKNEVEDELNEEGEIDDLEEGELKSDEDSVTGSVHSDEKSTQNLVSSTIFSLQILQPQIFCIFIPWKGSAFYLWLGHILNSNCLKASVFEMFS